MESGGEKWGKVVWIVDNPHAPLAPSPSSEQIRHPASSLTPRLNRGSMFLGRFNHNLDAKGRLAIPAKFRAGLADGMVLTRGIDRCLTLYPVDDWQSLTERVRALPITDANTRAFRRMVFAEAVDLELDAQGRILVPPELRVYAGLERATVIVGVDVSIEIWSPERWTEMSDRMDREGAEIAQTLADLL